MLAAADKRAAGLDALKVTTLTQLNRRTLPKLALGGNQVMLWADEQLETTEVWPPLHDGAYRQTAAQEDNAWSDKEPDGFYKATLGAGVDGKECSVTWKLEVPSEIHDVFYAVVSTNRTEQSYVSLQHSWDGKRFTEFDHNASGGFPMDNQVRHAIASRDVPVGAREAYFRSVSFCKSGAATYNAPGIEVAVSVDGRTWQAAGTIRHDDLWKPPGDFEAWEHDDDPRYAALPAGGRLAYGYPLVLKKPAAARYVRLICTPLQGKGMGLSEFQVFDAASVVPWPGEAALPAMP
jgi:hypothetical protein